jgi:acyl carrier protein
MNRTEVESRVKNVIARVLKTDVKDIKPESNFVFDLGADSMQSVALIAAFEEEFDVEMEEDKAREVQSVAGAVDFIAQYVK